jgi:hypothetical protein
VDHTVVGGHHQPMTKRAWIVAALGLATALGLVGMFILTTNEPEEKFCTMGLAYRIVSIGSESTDVALQDQGSPGDDGCDIDPSGPAASGQAVLGYDCRIRDGGNVLGSAEANRADGTCGQGGERGLSHG